MNPKEKYDERKKRVQTTVSLHEPDYVPIVPVIGAYPLRQAGFTIQDAMTDIRIAEAPLDRFFDEFQADLAWNPANAYYPISAFELTGINMFRWPGCGISDPNISYQFMEKEYMLEDEYADFNSDPTHFMETKWIPRAFSKLKGLEKMSLRGSLWLGFFGTFAQFADPELQDSIKALTRAGEALRQWGAFIDAYNEKLKNQYGFPLANTGAFAPFDMVGDTLRGTIPVLMDMHSQPEELMEAMEHMLQIGLENTLRTVEANGNEYVWFWLHKGVDEFMSDADYRKFYWGPLYRYLEALMRRGITPILHCQGKYNSRLHVLSEVPAGKIIYDFENIDMKKAKEILGDVACIAGNVPVSMLEYGTREAVETCCKKLIDDCAPGGGFIMEATGVIENAKPENLEAMYRSAKEYGRYR